MMQKPVFTLIGILLLVFLASAHAIEKAPVSRSTDNYTLQLSTEPEFPVTGKPLHIDIVIMDTEGNPLSDLDVKIELHKQGKTLILNLVEEAGHYRAEHSFAEAGVYTIHPVIEGREIRS